MAITKVLIVDDSKTELMFLTELLQKNGFTVRSAENADEAFKRLSEEKPHLILMDVVMPGQNGFQLTRAINRTPEYSKSQSSCAPARAGNRSCLGHAPGCQGLHHQAGRCVGVVCKNQGFGLITEIHGQ